MNHEAEIGIIKINAGRVRACDRDPHYEGVKPCLRLTNSIQGLTATSTAQIVVTRL